MLAAIGGDREAGVTGHSGERPTILDGGADTRITAGPGPEPYRETVLDDATRPRQRQLPAARGPEDYRATVLDETHPRQRQGPAAPGPEDYRATILEGPGPGSGPGSGAGGRGRSGGKGKARADGGPAAWPTVGPRQRSHRLAGLLSSVITFALVAGIAAYVWHKTHETLKVTSATVTVVHPGKIVCNTTVDVVGTIVTNGKGGPVTYQWTKDGENLPTGTVTAASGQQRVRVDLKWNLRGAGTHRAVAIFQVFTPNVITAESANFTYRCP
jgi:hypothetical protein